MHLANLMLYVHIISACAWVGGGMLLFGMAVFIKDKDARRKTYETIGPFYGYFESFWLLLLIVTGLWLLFDNSLFLSIGEMSTDIGYFITIKLLLVIFVFIATVIHFVIALKTNKKNKTKTQTVLSRVGSMAIFMLNFAILWYAILLRSFLK